jgi:hypothetical protein
MIDREELKGYQYGNPVYSISGGKSIVFRVASGTCVLESNGFVKKNEKSENIPPVAHSFVSRTNI